MNHPDLLIGRVFLIVPFKCTLEQLSELRHLAAIVPNVLNYGGTVHHIRVHVPDDQVVQQLFPQRGPLILGFENRVEFHFDFLTFYGNLGNFF